ncbi:phenylalanine--tRNA ligase subunit beta [Olivibacter sitiensis]|uniref:phenylalanine--tRNA ligase subunit beta n=1 Tax=Olivibacter sitiensis TaxID=376470 RepID=UPI00041ADBED|nr:phenylalanine--tRNA ligase subunit beta [Olivibacter sitiensis]
MKISYNWLKDFIQIDKTPEELALILTDVGLEVEHLELVQAIPGGLEGLVIGHVKSCAPHPNADRLRVTTVDVGGEELLHIVCGAPNVAEGQKVVVATVGTIVYPLEGESFKINKSKIRGEVSEGMICAEDEIGLGQSHDGIMVLDVDAPVGALAKEYFEVKDDYCFEIGLTPNRADAASHLGVARDVAAYLRADVKIPDVTAFVAGDGLTIPVEVEDAGLCPRYSSLTISGVEVKPSPDWLVEKLAAIGVRPINNIVDVTNYVLHALGQPMHAFDADKIVGGKVVVKRVSEGTPFRTLDGVERKLSSEDLMICNAEEPMCIAGVFGGEGSGVSEGTTKIFLESAYFIPVTVRKSSKRHGLKTDSSFRFERGTDPNMTVIALKWAALLIQELAGGAVSSAVLDVYPVKMEPFAITVHYDRVTSIIGKEIDPAEIKAIIEALDIKVLKEQDDALSIEVPPYRVDVTREIDVIEEILRIYGYNNVEIKTQIKASLTTSPKPDKEVLNNSIADLLIANGFNEIMCNSLTKLAYVDESTAVRIINPLSSDLDTMRQSLLFSGLEAISYNQKRRNINLKFFEFGKTYFANENGYEEQQRVSLFLVGNRHAEQWNNADAAVSFYDIKGVVDAILKRLGISNLQVEEVDSDHLVYGLAYVRGAKRLVSFGAVATGPKDKTDVSGEVFYADFDWAMILKAISKNKITYQEVSKFPTVRRDLSLLIESSVSFADLKAIAQKTERKLLKQVNVFDVYMGEKLPANKKSYALSFILEDDEKTLTDKQIDAVMQKLILNFEKQAGAEIRK